MLSPSVPTLPGGTWFPPLVVSLSNHERIIRLPFDRLRVSGTV
jgi:hypothetical protein